MLITTIVILIIFCLYYTIGYFIIKKLDVTNDDDIFLVLVLIWPFILLGILLNPWLGRYKLLVNIFYGIIAIIVIFFIFILPFL